MFSYVDITVDKELCLNGASEVLCDVSTQVPNHKGNLYAITQNFGGAVKA